MESTPIQASCCEVSDKPGIAHSTTLDSSLPGALKCSKCPAGTAKNYRIEYSAHDLTRITDFENRLRAQAQRAIDDQHPNHGAFVSIYGIDGPAIRKAS